MKIKKPKDELISWIEINGHQGKPIYRYLDKLRLQEISYNLMNNPTAMSNNDINAHIYFIPPVVITGKKSD